MSSKFKIQNSKIIALLVVGSAFLVTGWGCKSKRPTAEDIPNPESVVTQQFINHKIVESLNGVKKFYMTTPLMERHDMAREPFIEYPNGIEIITYDSIGAVENTISANYAIFYEKRELWEARGSVVGHNVSEERTLRTEQLFWDRKMGRIYSNVNSRVEQKDGIHFGEGFESDENFHNWLFRNYRGRVNYDPDALEKSDTTIHNAPVSPATTPATVIHPVQQTPIDIGGERPRTNRPAMREQLRRGGEEK